jgi:hypothetical protein
MNTPCGFLSRFENGLVTRMNPIKDASRQHHRLLDGSKFFDGPQDLH